VLTKKCVFFLEAANGDLSFAMFPNNDVKTFKEATYMLPKYCTEDQIGSRSVFSPNCPSNPCYSQAIVFVVIRTSTNISFSVDHTFHRLTHFTLKHQVQNIIDLYAYGLCPKTYMNVVPHLSSS
jgi:hypothetical protein